jgi:hypothetical protein
MVGGRRTAFGAVIDDEISRQRCGEVQQAAELMRDALLAVLSMGNRQVTIHYRKRIAVDREFAKLDTFLFRRQICRTQKAGPQRNRLAVNPSGCAADTMGNVTHEDVEPIYSDWPGLRAPEAFETLYQQRPGPYLAPEEFVYYADIIHDYISITPRAI